MNQKWTKRSISLFLAILIGVSFVDAPVASAEDAPRTPTKMWVAPTDANGIPAQIDLFMARTGGTARNPIYTYQLYLPGNVDPENCFLSWDGGALAAVNGPAFSSGACPVPPPNTGTETTYTFKDGDHTLTSLQIISYQGSENVTPVFIDIDESKGTIAAMDGDENHIAECSGRINIGGQWYGMAKIKGRGNATWKEAKDKKPYNITLEKKINFPGIDSAKTKKWSFLAEVLDHSLLCNRSGFYLAHELGVGQDTASADVWMNGEYQGCYTDTPKTDSFVTDDGYMIEQDNYLETKSVGEGGDPQFPLNGLNTTVSGWSSAYNLITVKKIGDNLLLNGGIVDESPENVTEAAGKIRTWLQDAWDAIRSDDGYNSDGVYYTDYIDIESFAKMYLMQEYIKSFDVCAGSILFYRDGLTDNDKLIAGPLWDLDNAMGSVYANRDLGNQAADRRSGEGDFIPKITEYKTSIYKTIYTKHDDFRKEVKRQYNQYRSSFENLPEDTQQMIDEIEASARMNHIKVTDLGNGTGKNNHYYARQTSLGSTPYQQIYKATTDSKTDWPNYAANLKTYITARSLWFDHAYYDSDYDVPATCEHQYESVTAAPTCIADGSVTYTCKVCHDTYTETLPKIAHTYVNGACTACGEKLLTVRISCNNGASVTVFETQNLNGPRVENAASAYPRDSETGLIDCGGDGQVTFALNIAPGYELENVAAKPTSSYKKLMIPSDTGIENVFRLTNVTGDVTISVSTSGHITFDSNGGEGRMNPQKITLGAAAVLNANTFTKTGYAFHGWNTKRDGSGTAYLDKATVTLNGNTILYAQWSQIGDTPPGGETGSSGGSGGGYGGSGGGSISSGPESYPIRIENTANGSVKLSANQAAKGDVIVITATPDTGYVLTTVTAAEKEGRQITLKDNGDGTFSFIMPDTSVAVTAGFKTNEHDCPSKKFTDLDPNAWYHESVDYAVEKGLMNGVETDQFAPNNTTTRAILVTILYRLDGAPAVHAANPFDDVPSGQWYTAAVIWASENGLIDGYGDGRFAPTDNITREQFATILYRYAAWKGHDGNAGKEFDVSVYGDAAAVSGWATEAMKWACGAGLFLGDGNHNLRPGEIASRAETAVILMRFDQSVQ